MMFQVLAVLCFVAVVNSEETTYEMVQNKMRSILAQNRDECLASSKADPALVDRLVADYHFPKDEPLKCYIACITLKTKFITEDMKIHGEVLTSRVPKEVESVIAEIIEKCQSAGSGTNCDIAYEKLKCVYTGLRDKVKKN
ncbi:hypothetical protein RN001_011980 [Aquatica leii]|uniref:Uncharacterized protein n=1 Tax=Aquatica leii TaxID=1421715 RepID=A0AAN7P4Y2_9COLE|nr:hypothetical protein RN001_011980 [Aquatica leii]